MCSVERKPSRLVCYTNVDRLSLELSDVRLEVAFISNLSDQKISRTHLLSDIRSYVHRMSSLLCNNM